MRVGNGEWLPFGPSSMLIVPARQPHVVGDAGPVAQLSKAEDRCSMLADGLVALTAGNGSRDILLLCGAISASHGSGLGLFDLWREPVVENLASDDRFRQVFGLMLSEVANPGLGTRAMTEALTKQCLIALLRQHLRRDGGSPLFTVLNHPRLARAVVAVIEDPAVAHSVESLVVLAGMSRASFAEHFSRAFQQGPMEFVQKVRLRVAARLLATTDLPVKTIAQSVGYTGPTPFSRAFRGVYGADPLTYRGHGGHDEREPGGGKIDAMLDAAPQSAPRPGSV